MRRPCRPRVPAERREPFRLRGDSPRHRAKPVLGSALLLPLVVASCARAPTERGYEYFPDMVDSVAYESFTPNPHLPGGLTLQAPPPGTIPRGHRPLHFGPGKEEAERAGRELVNPVAPSAAALARGEKVFATFCAVCHGPAGEGDGPIIPRFPTPPSLKAERARKMPDGQIFHVITFGQGLMAPYAAQVPAEDRWKVVLFIRSLQGGAR